MRIKEIQSLRALASILVVIYHAKLIGGGYIGVDIFYVISGYLITGLLLRELEKSKRLSFRAFYLRRIKRLLPTSYSVLIVTAISAWILYPATMRHDIGRDIAAASIYIPNYLFAFWQMDYQNLEAIPPVVIHYWSLAVEEQFYLVWPLLILIFYKRGGRRLVGRSVAAITALSFIWCFNQTQTAPIWAFYSLPTRAWELGVGALLLFVPEFTKARKALAAISLVALILGSLYFKDSTAFPGIAALLPVVGTAIAIATIGHWPVLVRNIAHTRIVQWLGDISYPLYLWHWPLLVIPVAYLGRGLYLYERVICITATLILSWLTHKWIEAPLRSRTITGSVIVKGASIATVVSLCLGLTIYSSAATQIGLPNGTHSSLTNILEKPLIYNNGCHLNYGELKSPDCTYGVRGAKVKIVLFGDSHAAQWFPALAKLAVIYRFELISLTKSSCPGPAVLKSNTSTYKNSDCATWRENSYRRISTIHPDAVIVSGMQQPDVVIGSGSFAQLWRDGEARTLAGIQASSPNLIYLVDTPHPARDIPSCVSTGLIKACNLTKASPAYTISGFHNINPNRWLCQSFCPAILNNQVVYRDASHISVAMSELLAGKLFSSLESAGVHF